MTAMPLTATAPRHSSSRNRATAAGTTRALNSVRTLRARMSTYSARSERRTRLTSPRATRWATSALVRPAGAAVSFIRLPFPCVGGAWYNGRRHFPEDGGEEMATVPTRRPAYWNGYPTTDRKPMAETDWHRDLMAALIATLQYYFASQPRVYVSGNLLVFYERGNRRRHVSPDVFVVRGVEVIV